MCWKMSRTEWVLAILGAAALLGVIIHEICLRWPR